MTRRTLALLLAACLSLVAAPSPALGTAEELPNLVTLPAFELELGASDESASIPALRFATAVANRGDFPLDLFGEPEDAVGRTAKAQQCVRWAAPHICRERREVGKFSWHPEHGHHHLEDFALYELRRLRKDGMPDMRSRGLVATGGKISFCIIDARPDGDSGAPIGNPLYYSCFVGGFQGISPGWRDVYGNRTTGQQILTEGLPDGIYALVVTIDPDEKLLEATKSDNRAVVGIELSGNGTRVEQVCASEPGELKCLRSDG